MASDAEDNAFGCQAEDQSSKPVLDIYVPLIGCVFLSVLFCSELYVVAGPH